MRSIITVCGCICLKHKIVNNYLLYIIIFYSKYMNKLYIILIYEPDFSSKLYTNKLRICLIFQYSLF